MDYDDYHRDYEYKNFERLFRNMFMMRYTLISKFISKGKVLEVGSSVGTFLNIFKDRGWIVTGIEPSNSASIARSNGMKIIKSYFEKVKIPSENYDLVLLNHTLEHMEDPRKVLIKVNKILKKNGYLFIDVPNFGSLSSRILGKNWPYLLPEEHKWQFTKFTLSKIIQSAGFKIVWQGSRSGIFEYANPFIWTDLKHIFIDLFFLPYSFIATILNMGDSMSFIAQKND